jgi:hypothetical protein
VSLYSGSRLGSLEIGLKAGGMAPSGVALAGRPWQSLKFGTFMTKKKPVSLLDRDVSDLTPEEKKEYDRLMIAAGWTPSSLSGQPDAKFDPCADPEVAKNAQTTLPQPESPPEPTPQPTEPDRLMEGNPGSFSPGHQPWPDVTGTWSEREGFVRTADRQAAEERARTAGEPDEGELG